MILIQRENIQSDERNYKDIVCVISKYAKTCLCRTLNKVLSVERFPHFFNFVLGIIMMLFKGLWFTKKVFIHK